MVPLFCGYSDDQLTDEISKSSLSKKLFEFDAPQKSKVSFYKKATDRQTDRLKY